MCNFRGRCWYELDKLNKSFGVFHYHIRMPNLLSKGSY